MSLEEALIFEEGSISQTSVVHRDIPRQPISPGGVSAAPKIEELSSTSPVTESVVNRGPAVSWIDRLISALSGGGIFRKSVLALVDQGVVSAANFLTIVFLRRMASGPLVNAEHELGLYQLGFSLVMLTTCVQNALIAMPYAVFGNRLQGIERKRYAGSTLFHQGLFSILIAALFLVVGLALTLGWTDANFSTVALILAATTPFILVR